MRQGIRILYASVRPLALYRHLVWYTIRCPGFEGGDHGVGWNRGFLSSLYLHSIILGKAVQAARRASAVVTSEDRTVRWRHRRVRSNFLKTLAREIDSGRYFPLSAHETAWKNDDSRFSRLFHSTVTPYKHIHAFIKILTGGPLGTGS